MTNLCLPNHRLKSRKSSANSNCEYQTDEFPHVRHLAVAVGTSHITVPRIPSIACARTLKIHSSSRRERVP